MKTYQPYFVLLAFLLPGFALLAQERKSAVAEFPELARPVVERQSAEAANEPTVTAGCSQTKPGVVEVSVEWPAQLASFKGLRVDLSVYKQGFKQNKYAVLWPLDKTKKARAIDAEMFRTPEVTAGMELQAVALSKGDASQKASLKLEGLDPGKTYFWRVLQQGGQEWLSGPVIRIDAPVCPVDRVEDRQ